MTSMVTRDDIQDELYKLVGVQKAYEVGRFMKLVNTYAYALAHKMNEQYEAQDKWRHLKPGQTDLEAGMRRCAACGQVRDLRKSFTRDNRSPHGRKLRCKTCVPPPKDNKYPDKYLCRMCGERKILKKFPQEKRANPKVRYNCLDCAAIHRPTPQKRK